MFEKNLSIISLFDVYGAMLSEQKQKMFELYYGDDLSLSEIAEEMNISRQGVRESLKKCEEQLLHFEEKLGILRKMKTVGEAARELRRIGGENKDLSDVAKKLESLL